MITTAMKAAVPARWVAADEAYGNSGAFRSRLRGLGLGYVLAVSCDHLVPLDGGKTRLRADQIAAGLPATAWQRRTLHLAVDDPVGGGGGVRLRFEEQLAGIEEHLGWSRQQVDQHNQQMRAQIPGMVSRRRAELLATRNVQAEIGFPIRRRPDADTHSVPIKRRSLRPVQPSQAASPFEPEPTMADGDYDAALAVLRNSRNGLERSPSMVEKLDEEQIRDLLLFNLNAPFEVTPLARSSTGMARPTSSSGFATATSSSANARSDLQVLGLAGHQGRHPAVHPQEGCHGRHPQGGREDRGTTLTTSGAGTPTTTTGLTSSCAQMAIPSARSSSPSCRSPYELMPTSAMTAPHPAERGPPSG